MAKVVSVWRGDQVLAEIRQRGFRGLVQVGNLYRNEVIRLILRTPKTGRIYGNHQASAPGQPPASDTGRLGQSIRIEPQPDRLRVLVHIGARYAQALEQGTKRMKPRPFAEVANDNIRPRADPIMARASAA